MITVECQQTRELLDSYLSAELLVETNHQILRHLSTCTGCRAELARRHRVRLLMKAALPAEDPPAELVQRINQIPPGAAGGTRVPGAERGRSLWHRFGLRAHGSTQHRREQTASRTWARQALAGLTVAASILVLVGLGRWAPWTPARLTASELLGRSDQAARDIARRSNVVLHRSLNLEERRGAGRKIVARRRVEVWQNGTSGVVFRRAYDEKNTLVAAESLAADGARTVYRAGAPPRDRARPLEHTRLKGLDEPDENSAWRLELSATEYASLIPSATSAHVEDSAEHYLVKYEGRSVSTGLGVVEATLKLRRDTLLPVEQTVVLDRGGDRREYALTEAEFQTVPFQQVPAAAFEPEPILTGRVDRTAARLPDPEPALRSAPLVAPSLDAEVDVMYRLHRVDAWLRDAVTLSRTSHGTLEVAAVVGSSERRAQLLAVLTPAAANGVLIDVRVEPRDATLPEEAPLPPDDLRDMATYDGLRAGFAEFINSRVPAGERPAPGEQDRLIDGLVRNVATRNLDRAHGALSRALALDRTIRHFSNRTSGRLSADSEATLQTMLRDYARGIAVRLEALRLELQPMLNPRVPIEKPQPPPSITPPDLSRTAQQLTAAMRGINATVLLAFGPRVEGRQTPDLSDPAVWREIADGERLAAIFKEPLPLGAR